MSNIQQRGQNIFAKIISGGQTGTDQGALDAALELGHPCGGWCPRGRKSEAGTIPTRYPLQEHSSAEYDARTEANVRDSDGTLIFTFGQPTGGTLYTLELARKLRKAHLVIDLSSDAGAGDPERVWGWGRENQIVALNVAGPRESKHPGIQVLVKAVMTKILMFTPGCSSQNGHERRS